MRPARVLLDARMCDGRFDGVSRYVTRLAQALREAGRVTPVLLCGPSRPDELSGFEAVETDFGPCQRSAHRRLWWEQTRLSGIIRAARVDLFHATWNTGIPVGCPVPALLTVHDLIPLENLRDSFPSRLHRWSYASSLRWAVSRAARIVTVSDYVRSQCVERLRLSPERIATVHHGVDRPPEAEQKLPGGRDFVLYVGGAEPRKNVAGVFRAMDVLWREHGYALELRLTGTLERQCPQARAAYAALEHKSRVVFLGSPDDSTVRVLMASARALLMLSTAEGFGMPALEAMGCGCPAVVSNRTSLPEVVGETGVVVEPDDARAVAQAVRRLIHDPGFRAEVVARGRARAAGFSWQRAAAETLEVYDAALRPADEGVRRAVAGSQRRVVAYAEAAAGAPESPAEPEPAASPEGRRHFSLVVTVLNEAAGIRDVLSTLPAQTRKPDEVIVVDGGSSDGTVDVVLRAAELDRRIRLIQAPGANIARGRNIGIQAATGDVILLTDGGCRLDPHWTERMAAPFEEATPADFVAGSYKIDPCGLFESVVGMATMRGALEPIDPERFNPSCRSMAFTRRLWERVGGFPEWLYTAEDTLFDQKVRRLGVRWRFAGEAIVYWRPRTTWRAVYRQFRGYAVGSANIGQGGRDVLYHARNLLTVAALLAGGFVAPVLWILAGLASAYFFVLAFHGKSRRIAARLGTRRAYGMALLLHWVLIAAGLDGQIRSRLRRPKVRRRYRERLLSYLGLRVTPAG